MKNVLLLLADGFEMFEASAFIDVIGWNLVDGDHSTKLYSCGFAKEVRSSFKQKLIPDFLIDDINPEDYDALAIPSGFDEYGFYDDAYNVRFLDIIKQFNTLDKIIATICVGGLPVAKTGILYNKNATTYNQNPKRIQQLEDMGAIFTNEPIVVNDNIITSSNPATAHEVALLLLEKLTDKNTSQKIKSLMGFTNI
jgi:4-methyl-5(b-hydroxyethyl)-thiazole monophosphate biosynthesis